MSLNIFCFFFNGKGNNRASTSTAVVVNIFTTQTHSSKSRQLKGKLLVNPQHQYSNSSIIGLIFLFYEFLTNLLHLIVMWIMVVMASIWLLSGYHCAVLTFHSGQVITLLRLAVMHFTQHSRNMFCDWRRGHILVKVESFTVSLQQKLLQCFLSVSWWLCEWSWPWIICIESYQLASSERVARFSFVYL